MRVMMKKAFVMALFAIGIMGKSEVHANTHEYLVADTLSSEAFSKQLDAVSIEIKKAEVEVKNAKKAAKDASDKVKAAKPTSLPGQVTQTSPYGRDVNHCGWPIKVCEMLATLEGPEYITRVAVNNVKNVRNAKKAIKKAFQNQMEGKGFSLVEVVSACPTNWGMTPQQALAWVESDMLPYYPIGVYKDRTAAKEAEA